MAPLEFAFMQKALVASTVVAAVAPLVGAFIVQRGQSLVGDGMGHVAFAGVGLAFLVGVHPLLGALVLTAFAAVVLFRLERRGGLSGDLSLALVFYGGIAAGFLFAAKSGGGLNNVLGLLFGSALNLSWGQVAAIVALSLAVLLVVVALYGPLVALAFDEDAARVAGVRADALVLALTLLVALVVVGGMYSLGLLLVSAMMVIPVAAVSQVTSSYRATLLAAAAVGAGSALAGLFAAFYADLAPGASVVLVALACYLVLAVARGRLRSAR